MNIYQLRFFYNQGELYREYRNPKFCQLADDFYPVDLRFVFWHIYLCLKPNMLKNTELELLEKRSNKRLDVESIAGTGFWCTSQRFKEFIEAEKIPLDFFPVLVEGERRYLTLCRRLDVLTGYELDLKKSDYKIYDGIISIHNEVFRSDVIEYYNYQFFSDVFHISKYVTEDFKMKLEKEGFLLTFDLKPVTEMKFKKKKVEKDLIFARQKEREMYLTPQGYKDFELLDCHIEKVLMEEGDQQVLQKFQTEFKGRWKKDFERYEQGLMQPLEKITYW